MDSLGGKKKATCKVPWVQQREYKLPWHKQPGTALRRTVLCQAASQQPKNPLAQGNKHSLNYLLMYQKLRKRRWFCFKHSSLCERLWTGNLRSDSVIHPRVPEIKYSYFSSPTGYKIHLLNKFCFVPSAKCPSKQRFYFHISEKTGPKMDKPPR